MWRLIGLVAIILLIALKIDRCAPVTDLWRATSDDPSDSCRIKGNISLDGERIYHVPGGEWYDKTRIDRTNGERWFCSEAEAQAAGWRKAYQ